MRLFVKSLSFALIASMAVAGVASAQTSGVDLGKSQFGHLHPFKPSFGHLHPFKPAFGHLHPFAD